MDQAKAHFDMFGDSSYFGTRKVHVKWKLVSVRLGIVLVLAQDRCMVCAKHTIGLEIILDAPDGTPR
jgi:hypothetical protein